MSDINTKIYLGPETPQSLFNFRYKIYIEEMNRTQTYANHESKKIEDPLDNFAHNIATEYEGNVVGCLRINFSRDGDLGFYKGLYSLVGNSEKLHTVSISTRFMVAPSFRNTLVVSQLCSAAFKLGIQSNISFNYLDCNDHLVRFFVRRGYRFLRKINHQEYGSVNLLKGKVSQLYRLDVEKNSVETR